MCSPKGRVHGELSRVPTVGARALPLLLLQQPIDLATEFGQGGFSLLLVLHHGRNHVPFHSLRRFRPDRRLLEFRDFRRNGGIQLTDLLATKELRRFLECRVFVGGLVGRIRGANPEVGQRALLCQVA